MRIHGVVTAIVLMSAVIFQSITVEAVLSTWWGLPSPVAIACAPPLVGMPLIGAALAFAGIVKVFGWAWWAGVLGALPNLVVTPFAICAIRTAR